jgi:hypothetical protein
VTHYAGSPHLKRSARTLPNEGLGLCRGRDLCAARKRNVNHRPQGFECRTPVLWTPGDETLGELGQASPGVLLSYLSLRNRKTSAGLISGSATWRR